MHKIDFILYLISAILGGGGCWIIYKWGIRLSLMDYPNERSSHNTVTPKGGGIGILAAFLFCSLYTKISCWFWAPAASVSMIGLFADRFEILPQPRLIIQFVAGIITVIGIGRLNLSGINEIILILFFTFYIVGTGNYYNFMDGINGIAGITGLVGFGLLGWFASAGDADPQIITLCVCLSFACLGFLPFNMPRATVFMGDVGSILLGFVFAGIVVYLSRDLLNFICMAGFLFPFYADELTTVMVRLKDGEKLSKPHRRHFYQILANEYGIPHWKVSLGYGLFQLLVGISVIWLKNVGITVVLSSIIVYFCTFSILSFILRSKGN
jgi:UDP-N-acetylmuramyl pentapeptide phosphotransferase/UDP-N-acetylglucosamine-1-phosphate transferase